MAESHAVKLRVIIDEDNIQKFILPSGFPDTLEELQDKVQERFGIQGNLHLQFMDPDFDNQFVNIASITDLHDKGTIKVVRKMFPPSLDESEILFPDLTSPDCSIGAVPSDDSKSSGSDDTVILHVPSPQSARNTWPEEFQIPSFASSTELKLSQENIEYANNGTALNTGGIKSDIMEKLAESIFKYKAYPSDLQLASVAEALVTKHLCLKEQGSFNGWKMSLKFKMGNFRTKLRNAGCKELCANSLKRKPLRDQTPAKNVKKARKAEVNYLPDLPHDESESTLEKERLLLLDEATKRGSEIVINEKMDKTFALRRQEIVFDTPTVDDFQKRWPALFTEMQVCAEFMRITTKSLMPNFMAALDKHTPKFIQMIKGKGGSSSYNIKNILQALDQNMCQDATHTQREVVLKGLCEYLNEDSSILVKQCLDTEEDKKTESESCRTLGIFVIKKEDAPLDKPADIGITLEGHDVLSGIGSLAKAVALLFGFIIYALNISYPNKLKYTFEVIQKVFLSLDGHRRSPKVQILKNKLLM